MKLVGLALQARYACTVLLSAVLLAAFGAAQNGPPQGCTATGNVIGGQVWWGGCPSDSCDTGYQCNADNVQGNTWICTCSGGSQSAKCRADVQLTEEFEVIDWSCSNQSCSHSCSHAEPPSSGTFYLCFC